MSEKEKKIQPVDADSLYRKESLTVEEWEEVTGDWPGFARDLVRTALNEMDFSTRHRLIQEQVEQFGFVGDDLLAWEAFGTAVSGLPDEALGRIVASFRLENNQARKFSLSRFRFW